VAEQMFGALIQLEEEDGNRNLRHNNIFLLRLWEKRKKLDFM